ncbi:MAG TPA: glycine cleavage system protein GcvH [bacterium]|nr:glycine cleavage system protein GcvH [bacterium]
MNVPQDLRYTKDHEWVKVGGDVAVMGISDYAQDALGDIVFLELPDVGATFSAGDAIGVVESVKAVSDIYCAVSGEVVETNEALVDAPETVNGDPYVGGWMVKIKMSDPAELDALMDAAAYEKYLAEETE